MTKIQILVLFIIFIVNVFDPIFNAFWCDKSKSWLFRHIPKWLAFYPPIAFLAIYFFHWWSIPIAVGSFIVWRLSIRYIAGKKWRIFKI